MAATLRAATAAIARAVTGRSWQREVVEFDASARNGALAHGALWRSPALRRAARVEDLEAIALLVERHMGVAEDHRVRVGESQTQPLETALRRTGVVDHTQNYVLQLQRDRLRELAAEPGTVDVAVNRGDRPELAQVGEDRRFAEVAGVDDQVGTAQDLETAIR
jgi:hypothetical protein